MSYEDDCNEYYFGIPFKKRVSKVEAEPKFKVGDRVRVIDAEGGGKVGDIGTVTAVDSKCYGGPYYHLDGVADIEGLLEKRLAPYNAHPFTVGDRVKLKRHFGSHACGDEGDVVHLSTKAGFSNATAVMDPYGVYSKFPVECLSLVSAADCAVRKEQPKFKAGDVVRNGSGGVYTIANVKTHWDFSPYDVYDGPLAYDYANDEGFDWESSLELVTLSHPCIVARVLDGQPRPSNIPFVHASVALATDEAERLAKNNPGQEFAVYQRVGARVCEVQYNMKEVA